MRITCLALLAILVGTSSSLMCGCEDNDDSGSQPSGGRSGGGEGGAANGGNGGEASDDAGDSSAEAGDRASAGFGGGAGDSGSSGGAGGSTGTSGGAGHSGSSGGGGSFGTPPACGDIGTSSNDLVVTVNGVEHDFSDASVRFQYLGEGYHSITLQEGDVSVTLTVTASTFSDCPAVRGLPSSGRGLPWVAIKNTAGNLTRSYDPSAPGAGGTFTMIGYHVITSPSHKTLGVAFSCDECLLPERTSGTGDEGGGRSSATIHGEVHLLTETP